VIALLGGAAQARLIHDGSGVWWLPIWFIQLIQVRR
jgi:hypothetical protein